MFRDVALMIDLKLMVWTVPGKSGINGSTYNFECRDNEEFRDNEKMLKKQFIYSLLSKVLVIHFLAGWQQRFSSRKLLLLNNKSVCAIKNKIGGYQGAVEPIFMVTRKLD